MISIYRIPRLSRKKSLPKQTLFNVRCLVSSHPLVNLSLCHADDVLGGVGRGFAAANIQEVQASGGLVQAFLVTGGVAVEAADELLDQGSGFGIVLFL